MSDTKLFRFSAKVNGTTRRCTVRLYKEDADPESAELIVMNDSAAYEEFYRGASPEDYEASLEDLKLRPYR